MKRVVFLALLTGIVAAVAIASSAAGAEDAAKCEKVFELRTYIANPGKLEALHTRFREHTNALFQKHGVEIIGFWTPATGPEAENTLIYIVAFPSVEAQKKAWAGFMKDPVWIKAKKESEVDGVLVKKVIPQNLKATDYSPIR
jgi:hypothetical protein